MNEAPLTDPLYQARFALLAARIHDAASKGRGINLHRMEVELCDAVLQTNFVKDNLAKVDDRSAHQILQEQDNDR